MLPQQLPAGQLRFIFGDATSFQIKNFDADKRLYVSTADGSAKSNLVIQVESMLVPVAFERGLYAVDGNVINDPTTWASLRGTKAVQPLTKLRRSSP